MNIPSVLLKFAGSVSTYLGDNGKGERLYGDPVSFRCFQEAKRRLYRNSTTGDERLSTATAWCRRDAAGGPTAFVPGSLVTITYLGSTIEVELIECLDRNGGGLSTPDHLELVLG